MRSRGGWRHRSGNGPRSGGSGSQCARGRIVRILGSRWSGRRHEEPAEPVFSWHKSITHQRNRGRYMQLGMIGLGRMGANMVRRLSEGGHECVVFDMSPKAVEELVEGEGDRRRLACGSRQEAREAARGLADGSGRGRRQDHRRSRCRCSKPATSSSTAAIPTTSTTSGAPRSSRRRASTMSTSAPAAASGAWSAATA